MYKKLSSLFESPDSEKTFDKLTILKYIQYLQYYDENNRKGFYIPSFSFESIIDLISSHFYLIEKDNLKKISLENLYLIIRNENIKLKDEDSLFDLINEIFSTTKTVESFEKEKEKLNKMVFYEEVKIENLSEEKKIEFYSNIEFNQMTNELWNKVRNILLESDICSKTPNQNEARYARCSKGKQKEDEKITKIEYDNNKSNMFKGVISHICNGNAKSAKENGIIDVTASSIECSGEEPINALNYDTNNPFVSDHKPNSWLCIVFKDKKVNPSHYSIKSFSSKSYYKPMSWAVEGSNDGNEFELNDKREGDKSLDVSDASNVFEVRKETSPNKYYRYIRIRQTGVNSYKSNNDHRFVINCIEYFGLIQAS